MNLIDQLIKHEGYRQFPYHCTAGKLTVGIGRNLDDVGISYDEAIIMLSNDIKIAEKELYRVHPWAADLDSVRRDALINMCFNMGIVRLSGFRKMFNALFEGDFEDAAREALDSKWAAQVKSRAFEIAHMLKTGEYS